MQCYFGINLLGGDDWDEGYGIAVDAAGNAYATGFTKSSGWVSGGWDTSLDGGYDGYVLKIRETITGIQGRLRRSDTLAPLARGVVIATGPGGTRTGLADLNGEYLIQGLPEGAYAVTAYARRMVPGAEVLDVQAGQMHTLDFALAPRATVASIEGTVADDGTSQPLGGVRVDAYLGAEVAATTFTYADGGYEFGPLAGGKATQVRLVFGAEDYAPAEKVVEVTPDQPANGDATLTPKSLLPGVITGWVRIDGVVTPGARVSAGSPDAASQSSWTDEAGEFGLQGIALRTEYLLQVSVSGYESPPQSVRIDEGTTKRCDFDLTQRSEPVPPSNVAASDAAFTNKVQVTWASVAGADITYHVYRDGAAIGAWQSATTYDDTGATRICPAVHAYVVTAKNTAGVSVYSPSDTGCLDCTLPAAPTGVSASDGAYTDKVRVTWTAVAGGGITYRVYRDGAAIGTWQSATTYDDTGATRVCPNTHGYTVKAKNACGQSAFSASDAGCLQECVAPAAPTDVGAADGAECDYVRITWTAAAGAGITYQVYRDGAPISGWQAATSYEDYGAAPCTREQQCRNAGCAGTQCEWHDVEVTHAYAVQARNDGGESALSASDTGYRSCCAKCLDADATIYEKALPVTEAAPGAELAVRVIAEEPIEAASVWAVLETVGWVEGGGVWRATVPGDDRDGWVVFTPSEALVAGGAVYRIGPAGVFDAPVPVWIPVPAGADADGLEVCYFSEAEEHRGWYRAENVIGWMVPGSRRTVVEEGQTYIEIEVNHSGVVQLAGPVAAPKPNGAGIGLLLGVALVLSLAGSKRAQAMYAKLRG